MMIPAVGASARGPGQSDGGGSKIMVVRPYGPRIREPVFAVLAALDLKPTNADIVADTASDVEAVALVRERQPQVLVCPFHSVRMADGTMTHGVRFLLQLERGWPEIAGRLPVLMPVSTYSAAVFEGVMRMGDSQLGRLCESWVNAILRINEAELNEPEALTARVRAHLDWVRGGGAMVGA